MTQSKTVYLVGAGPGHPGLLTLRAVDCLRQADLVLYDKLVPVSLLDHAPPGAERVCVADLSPCHSERHLPIHETMIAAARQGKTVVRLKGGDPSLFGRGGEEAQSLRRAGIPFEIIPGVTAALGAAAFAGMPLTHRQHASAVAFVTGHEDPGKPESILDWGELARFPGTLVVYMGMSRLEKIMAALIAAGKAPSTPAAVVHWTSTGEQRTVQSELGDLTAAVRTAGLPPPAVIIIGSVVNLRAELNWFEKLPLFGKRVLVTRPRHQAGDLVHKLVSLGAVPLVLPTVLIREPGDWVPVDRAIARLAEFHWLVFTSANGVHYFVKRLLAGGRDLRALGSVKLAAIGPKTAEALRTYHVVADLVPETFQSEDLARALVEKIHSGDRVLLARADRGRDVLREQLAKVCEVEQIVVYSQVDAMTDEAGAGAKEHGAVMDQLRRGEIDFVTLTSSNIALAFFRGLDATSRARVETGHTRLVSISPVTSADIRAAGFPVAAEARQATTDSLVEALTHLAVKES